MTETIEEYEQWKLDGNCAKCKRQRYCTKGCKRNKEAKEQEISNVLMSAIAKHFGKFPLRKAEAKEAEGNDEKTLPVQSGAERDMQQD